MQGDVEIRPEHLGHRRFGAEFTAFGQPGDGAEGVESIGLRLDPRVRDAIGVGGVAVDLPGLHQTFGGREEAGRTAQRHPALIARRAHRGAPAAVHGSDDVLVGDEHVVEEDLPETGVPAQLGDRPYGHPVGAEVEHQVGEPAVPLGGRVGAEQSKGAVAERGSRTPDLLAVEPPTAVGPGGGRPQRRQVAAGLGFRPRLGPDLLAAGHLGQHAPLLLLGAVGEQCWAEHRGAVRAGATRRSRAEVLLLVNDPLQQRRVPAAVLLGPGDDRQARVEQHPVPVTVLLESLRGVVGLRREVRSVGREELAHLGAELFGVVVERQVHQLVSRSSGLTTFPPGFRGSASTKATDRGVLKFARC